MELVLVGLGGPLAGVPLTSAVTVLALRSRMIVEHESSKGFDETLAGDDGKVHVSKMNTGVMGKVFGGTVAEVRGGHASQDEARMLESIIRH